MREGWLKLYRQSIENPIFRSSAYWHVWTYFLMEATHVPIEKRWNNKKIELKPGQLITGREMIKAKTGVGESTIQRAIDEMRQRNMIETLRGNPSSLITIKNWESFQSSGTSPKLNRNKSETSPKQERNESERITINKELENERIKDNLLTTLEEGTDSKPPVPRRVNPRNPFEKEPTEEEWTAYARKHDSAMDIEWATNLYNHYKDGGWVKKNGEAVKDWQSTLRDRWKEQLRGGFLRDRANFAPKSKPPVNDYNDMNDRFVKIAERV